MEAVVMESKIDLLCGYTCNNNCLFCFVKGRSQRDRTTEEVKSILNELKSDGCNLIFFNGGEPTIRSDFLELVRYAKAIGIQHVCVTSNGRMFYYKEFAKEVAQAGLELAIISIHGADSKTHDFLTQTPGSFAQTIQGMQNLIDAGVLVTSNTTIVKQNYKQLPRIISMLSKFKLGWKQFILVHPGGAAWQNFEMVVPTITEVTPYLHKALSMKSAVNVGVEGIPYCFMQGYESFVKESQTRKLVGLGFRIDDVPKSRKEEAKIKSPECSGCRYNDECEGVWRAYAERYGLGELKPVK